MKRNKKFSKEESEFVRFNYPNSGPDFCSEHLGRSRIEIVKHASYIKIKLSPDLAKQMTIESFKRKSSYYKINPEQFYNIIKPEVAYFLGYLWADGYVKTFPRKNGGNYVIRMLFLKKDYLSIKDALDSLGQWGCYDVIKQKESWQDTVTIITGNKPLVEFLIANDYQEKSIKPPFKILSKIPNHIKHYFWRGYFDGDGHFSMVNNQYRFKITSTFDQDWSEHIKLFKLLNIKFTIIKTKREKSSHSDIICNGMEDCFKWGNYIYGGFSEDKIGLERKYEKFLIAKNRYDFYQKCLNLEIDKKFVTELNKENLLTLIKKYYPYIGPKKIIDLFKVKPHTVTALNTELRKEGKINTTYGKVRTYILINE